MLNLMITLMVFLLNINFVLRKMWRRCLPTLLPAFRWALGSSSEEETNFEVPFRFLVPTDSYNYEQQPPRTNFIMGQQHVLFTWMILPDKSLQQDHNSKPIYQSSVLIKGPSKMELAGTVIITMRDSKESEGVGFGRTNCACKYVGSVSCVRQHILEAREKLKKKIGMKAFFDLDFGEMGEVVAELWSAEEEQLFQEVVFSNLVSLKNFWDHLAIMFPSRTKKQIASYYFNVFMLGYLNCPSKEMELLTCSVIEVYGAGSWNHKAGDGR